MKRQLKTENTLNEFFPIHLISYLVQQEKLTNFAHLKLKGFTFMCYHPGVSKISCIATWNWKCTLMSTEVCCCFMLFMLEAKFSCHVVSISS